MKLRGLHRLFKKMPELWDLADLTQTGRRDINLIDAAKSALVAFAHREAGRPVMVVTNDPERAKQLFDDLCSWCSSDTPPVLFPEYGVLPYEKLVPESTVVIERMRIVDSLYSFRSAGFAPLVVTSVNALCHKTIAMERFSAVTLELQRGDRYSPEGLMRHLGMAGYETVDLVEIPGCISRRGGIVDVFSPGFDRPARIEFFGDELENIRWFDPKTQRSLEMADLIRLIPARELVVPTQKAVNEAFGSLDLSNCSDQVRNSLYEDAEMLSAGNWRADLTYYAPLFNEGSLVDYLPCDSLLIIADPERTSAELDEIGEKAGGIRRSLIERGELPGNFPRPWMDWQELKTRFNRSNRVWKIGSWEEDAQAIESGFKRAQEYGGGLGHFFDDLTEWLGQGHRIIIVSQQDERLSELLTEHGFPFSRVTEMDYSPLAGSLTLVHGALSRGWTLENTRIITDYELFGFTKQRRLVTTRRSNREVFVADLQIGDYVVHIDHGIARFVGMTTLPFEGREREYMILEYADNGKLYVPSDQVDRVTRYVGAGGYVPSLSRLHTHEWTRTKERVQKATVEMAEELLSIYASREVSTGLSSVPDTLWDRELEASFPYEETPDQTQTIQAVKADMESQRPMDRLVCGDVGYGKTEVAVRAAFKAVNSGMQVAVLVPTTVLAQQHYNTFIQRLAAFPVSIEVLSRFRSPAQQHQVLEGLANGTVDICIGTHRLIQKDVIFRNLGLVVIDEEQKFGVAHKERLKKLRSEVDVLTLSATPIPRSLHMSMIGVRDMSTIETAPEARLPVKTYVTRYNDETVRQAIWRELDRGGQVFFVHNRVQSINMWAEHLKRLVPQARIAVAHGQMREEMLEGVMVDFMKGNQDLLVCTTIIESGLDLPGTNTLIINQADKMGLTQLYHLRGRVGRGDVRAYAYLLYDRDNRLTETASKRLQTIFEAAELGAGFRIAMKDLEIRGAGNILGPEQSGHIGAVGFDLYCRLLTETVKSLSAPGGREPALPDPTVDLPIRAYIPETYVTDINTRLAIYQRLSALNSPEQTRDLWGEFRDRFGEVPQEVEDLLFGIRIKLLARQASIPKIQYENNKIVVHIEGVKADPSFLLKLFGTSIRIGRTKMSLDIQQLGEHWKRILEEVLKKINSNRS